MQTISRLLIIDDDSAVVTAGVHELTNSPEPVNTAAKAQRERVLGTPRYYIAFILLLLLFIIIIIIIFMLSLFILLS